MGVRGDDGTSGSSCGGSFSDMAGRLRRKERKAEQKWKKAGRNRQAAGR